MSNLIILPTAKTYLYNGQIKLTKETMNEVINLVYDNISNMTRKQSNNLNKRLKIYDELIKLLPPGKHKLLLKYEELNARETDTVLEEAITFVIKNEKEINDVLVN
ncbi:MAG: hypothetical protein ACYDIA_02375 [Candidatus Humimicrobiaceae bacterium]